MISFCGISVPASFEKILIIPDESKEAICVLLLHTAQIDEKCPLPKIFSVFILEFLKEEA